MKQIIMDVLDDMSESQINLASETARETVSSLISAALKSQGYNNRNKVNSYLTTDLSEEEQRTRDSWVCSICGENTADVDYDYIGSGTNHLGCEMKSWDEIKDYVNKKDDVTIIQDQDDSDYYTGPDREKNWLQKKHEDKVFGGDTGIDADFNEAVFGDSKDLTEARIQSDYKNKLSEEIVDNKDEKYIYESPDGGKKVYRRKFGEDKREIVTNWKEVNKNEG